MLVLLERVEHDETTFAATQVGPLVRLRARLLGFRLDRELAAGACPDSTPALAVRAQILLEPGMRQRLSRGFRRVLVDADSAASRRPLHAALPMGRPRIRAAVAEIEELADRLAGTGPLAVRGVAQASLLLTDGAGPLYASSARDLRLIARAVTDALDSRHEWA